MTDEEGLRRRAAGLKGEKEHLLPESQDDSKKESGSTSRKGLCSLCTCALLANPCLWLLPAPFDDVFKRAVGAARGNKEAKQHCLRVLQAWILVGALIIGMFVAMLDTGLGTGLGAEKETLFHQIFGFACIFGAALALSGPIIMSSVLYLCTSSVDPNNFDLFFALARSFYSADEMLTWLMCLDCFFCLALLPFVMFADGDALFDHAPAVDFLNGLCFAYISMAGIILLTFFVLWHINTIVLATLHAGLLTNKRIDDDSIWSGSHAAHDRVVDVVVREALKHQDVDDLLKYLVQVRGEDPSEMIKQARQDKQLPAESSEDSGGLTPDPKQAHTVQVAAATAGKK